ncbi:MAG TPA: CAP domain-containing protein [Bacillota bacterium]
MFMLTSFRARFVSSLFLTVALMFAVLVPAMAGTYYYYSGGYSSSPYYTAPSGSNTSGSGGTYYSGSYSTKYQSNYSTQYQTNYTKYYYYTSHPSNSQPSYTPPQSSTPVEKPKPTTPNPPVSNPSETSPAPSGSLTSMEQKMVTLVNQERAKAGLQQLKVDMPLVNLARKKSQDMIDKGYFGHTSPTYGSPFDMMKNAGIKYYTAGENLAGAGSVESAHSALMASPGHRANILNSKYNYFGVGVATGGPYGNMFTQLFVGR